MNGSNDMMAWSKISGFSPTQSLLTELIDYQMLSNG